MEKGLIFDIKKYSIHDGPGIRTTVFFKGCPLKCWWCHNPEGQSYKPELVHDKNKCIKCLKCIATCNNKALNFDKNAYLVINEKKCNLCGICVSACPSQALEIIGKSIDPESILNEILKDSIFYEESNGGVTISGGEPLAQPKFLKSLLHQCKKHNLHIVIDTCGYAPSKFLSEIKGLVDLFLFDLKILDEKKHIKYTGKSNRLILNNLKLLLRYNKNIIIRIPLIPNITATNENIIDIINYLQPYKSSITISLLPFHNLGEAKYDKLRREYKMKNLDTSLSINIDEIKRIFIDNKFTI